MPSIKHVILYPFFKVGGRTGIILLLTSLVSCGQKGIEPALIGTWVSGKQKINVHAGPGATGYRFVSDYASTVPSIREVWKYLIHEANKPKIRASSI